MTVAELIAKLQTLPPELPIIVSGYERGLDDLDTVDLHSVVRDYYAPTQHSFGRHKTPETKEEETQAEPCVYLGGRHDRR
jgi:hypothetical protein